MSTSTLIPQAAAAAGHEAEAVDYGYRLHAIVMQLGGLNSTSTIQWVFNAPKAMAGAISDFVAFIQVYDLVIEQDDADPTATYIITRKEGA